MKKITVLINCPDQPGIIAAVTGFLAANYGNIVYIDQHVDREQNIFFMRFECQLREDYSLEVFQDAFAPIATKYKMSWEIYTEDYIPKMALFVSRYEHCMYDILARYQSGELRLEIPFIISNHADLAPIAEKFGIPYHHIPVDSKNKALAEDAQLALLEQYKVDFVVLARYMQIVTSKIIEPFKNRIINIHHSFLPAFVGAKPYHSAYKRGVKIIGATSHYVTEELDAGPIIEQDVVRVSHSHSIKDFISKGRDLEKIVLANAIKLHVQRKVMVFGNKTVIFS